MACSSGSLVTAPTFTYNCALTNSIRSAFIKSFIAVRDDVTITDISDNSEIAGYVSSETMFSAPELTGEQPFPTTGDEITENCKSPQPTSRTYAFNFTSVRVDVSGLTDSTSWETLSDSLGQWTIAPVTCDNIILVPQNFATTGQFFKMTGTISTLFDNSTAMKYEGQLQFKYDKIIKVVELTDAVATTLGLTGTTSVT